MGSSPTGLTFCYIAGSSNGRTAAFEVAYLGSNPSPAAKDKSAVQKVGGRLIT